MIDFLNANAGAVTGATTVALLIVTAFYAFTTHLLFKEARTTRLLSSEPRVVGYLRTNEVHMTVVQLHVANLSPAAAVDVSASLTCATEWPSELRFEDSQVLKDISFLRPDEVIRFDLGFGPDFFCENKPAEFDFEITYSSLDGRNFRFADKLQVASIAGNSNFKIYTIDDVARRLKDISKALTGVTSNRRIRVDTFSNLDRKMEREELDQWKTERRKGQQESE